MTGRGNPGGGLVQQYVNDTSPTQLHPEPSAFLRQHAEPLSGTNLHPIGSHKPEDIQVTLSLRTTTSAATFPLDPPADSQPPPFYIEIHASVKFSKHPHLPITLATWRNPLERRLPSPQPNSSQEEPSVQAETGATPSTSPVWMNSALTPLRSMTHPSKFAGPAALGLVACGRGGYSRDLRESWDFITVPPAGQGEVVVKHLLPRDDLRFWGKTGAGEEMKPEKGEKYVIGPSERGLGTFWWRWGDLKGDLAGKEFRADEWWEVRDAEQALAGEGGEWVESEGEGGFGLTMEVESEAVVEFA